MRPNLPASDVGAEADGEVHAESKARLSASAQGKYFFRF